MCQVIEYFTLNQSQFNAKTNRLGLFVMIYQVSKNLPNRKMINYFWFNFSSFWTKPLKIAVNNL